MARRRPKEITVPIRLTPDEQIYLSTCCIGRVASSALKVVPEDYEHWEDLQELIDIVEPLRMRLADAIFVHRVAEEKEQEANVVVIHHGGDNGKE